VGLEAGVRQEFTGKERDAETRLDFFGARYMSSAQGRFTNPDPMNLGARIRYPQTWNMYSYTLNNPLRYVDASGDGQQKSITKSSTEHSQVFRQQGVTF